MVFYRISNPEKKSQLNACKIMLIFLHAFNIVNQLLTPKSPLISHHSVMFSDECMAKRSPFSIQVPSRNFLGLGLLTTLNDSYRPPTATFKIFQKRRKVKTKKKTESDLSQVMSLFHSLINAVDVFVRKKAYGVNIIYKRYI